MTMFKPASNAESFLRLALTGPSGSGKTFGALKIADGLGGKIAVCDTEHGSASLPQYRQIAAFDVCNLHPPYSPERFIEVIDGAEKAGYGVLIIDSASHEWSGKGGCLELVDELAKAKFRGNSWSAWSEVTPRHRAFIEAVLRARMHLIFTMRSKTETAQVDRGGRKEVVRLGMKSEQRDGVEYEFTVVLDIIHDGHFAVASKDRTGLFSGDPKPITRETGVRLSEWLRDGAPQMDVSSQEQETPAAPAPTPPLKMDVAEETDAVLVNTFKLISKATVAALDKLEPKVMRRMAAGEITESAAKAILVRIQQRMEEIAREPQGVTA